MPKKIWSVLYLAVNQQSLLKKSTAMISIVSTGNNFDMKPLQHADFIQWRKKDSFHCFSDVGGLLGLFLGGSLLSLYDITLWCHDFFRRKLKEWIQNKNKAAITVNSFQLDP